MNIANICLFYFVNVFSPSYSRLEHCMFQNWYPNFRHVSFKSEIIPLPEEFAKYLGEDGVS